MFILFSQVYRGISRKIIQFFYKHNHCSVKHGSLQYARQAVISINTSSKPMINIIDQTCSLHYIQCGTPPSPPPPLTNRDTVSAVASQALARTWFTGRDNPPLTPDGDNQTGTTMAADRKFDNCSSLTANTVADTNIPRMECAGS